ncbi:PrgI family protein [Clostridium cochlearium]|uniref:PrgI family protein n=1 Tax=Clostridium cochlearium TaxID=1494 RepID=UPI00241DB0A1|nr:PrgI family protein [Clostridium cochlearium]MBE6065918.1 PrgI family protein [Clostridium cochlearium]
MSIEVRIPKEITEYKAKQMFGFNLRESISIVFSIGVSFIAYNVLKQSMSLQDVTSVLVLLDAPILMFGFTYIKDLPLERFILLYILNKFINPANRTYTEIDIFDEVKIDKTKKGVINGKKGRIL